MTEYFLPIVNEPTNHSGNIYAFAFSFILVSILIYVIINKKVQDKNKLHNFSHSLIMTSAGVFIVALILGTLSNHQYDMKYSKQVSELQNQIIENNPEVKHINFMKGGNPAPDISPNGPLPKHSKIFECYNDSTPDEKDTGFIAKNDGTFYHATIKRTTVDNDEKVCEYSLTIGEKIEPEYERSVDGLPF